jgi:hypothetical protein
VAKEARETIGVKIGHTQGAVHEVRELVMDILGAPDADQYTKQEALRVLPSLLSINAHVSNSTIDQGNYEAAVMPGVKIR